MRSHLRGPIYGVLGNHDTIRMVPGLEAMGIRMLLNECETIARGDQRIHLAGIDDAHFYRVDNIEKAAMPISRTTNSPSCCRIRPRSTGRRRTPHFDLMLSGHTHGGQICLPGSIPITLEFGAAATNGGGGVAV